MVLTEPEKSVSFEGKEVGFGCHECGSVVLLPSGSTGSEDLSLAHFEFVKEDFRPVTFCFQMFSMCFLRDVNVEQVPWNI